MRSIELITGDIQAVAEVYPAGSGHFVYTSSMHGDGYVNYRGLGTQSEHHALLREASVALLFQAIKQADLNPSKKIAVIGPETMGATMIDRLREADHSGMIEKLTLCTLKLLKSPSTQTGFVWEVDAREKLRDAQIIVMDDLLNQSSTFKKINEMVSSLDQQIAVMTVIGDRCNVSAKQLGIKAIVSLEQFAEFTVQDPVECMRCTMQEPIILKPGHGHNFQKEHPNYPGGFKDHP